MKYLILVLILVCPSAYAQWYVFTVSNTCDYAARVAYCSSEFDGVKPWRVRRLGSSINYCGSGLAPWHCEYYNSGNPCSSGETWHQATQQCQPDTCAEGQIKFNGVCVDVQDCGNGTTLVDSTDPAECLGTDGTECEPGEYFYSVTEECLMPDEDQGSSSSDSSSSDGSTSSDSSSSEGSTSSSGDGGSTSDGSGGSTSSGSDLDLSEVVSELNEANEHLQDISDSLDGEGASFDGSVSPGVQSLYESEYPNGIAGVWESQKTALMDTPVFGFMNQFQFNYNDTSLPVWSMCFDLGAMGNFGCKDLTVPAYVWAFVKIVMLVSTAFLCRRLIFGG